jgi:hypothetical protein
MLPLEASLIEVVATLNKWRKFAEGFYKDAGVLPEYLRWSNI